MREKDREREIEIVGASSVPKTTGDSLAALLEGGGPLMDNGRGNLRAHYSHQPTVRFQNCDTENVPSSGW